MFYSLIRPCDQPGLTTFPTYPNDALSKSKKITLFHAIDLSDDLTGSLREAIFKLDILALQEAVRDKKISPNSFLNIDRNLVVNISTLYSLAMPKEVIDRIEVNLGCCKFLPEEGEPLPPDIQDMVENFEYIVERKPSKEVVADYEEKSQAIITLLKSNLEKSEKKERLREAFNAAYNNVAFMQDFDPELLKGKKISLLELAVKIKDLDFILCLLDNGATLDPWDWTKGSFFYDEGTSISDLSIQILEALISRNISLDNLVTADEDCLGQLVRDIESKDLSDLLERHGYPSYIYDFENDPLTFRSEDWTKI